MSLPGLKTEDQSYRAETDFESKALDLWPIDTKVSIGHLMTKTKFENLVMLVSSYSFLIYDQDLVTTNPKQTWLICLSKINVHV